MCGICGVADSTVLGRHDETLVAAMTDSLEHRGPDDHGSFASPQVCLGMRRLSIIDLAGGHQPLRNEDRSLVLVANGEIYNSVELRRTLEARGHRFGTHSDCEVILHLYEERGADCVLDLRGMFAFALVDTRRGILLLARDRIGEKPLYLWSGNQRLVFSSEMKSLLRALPTSPRLNHESLDRYLHYQFVPEPATLFAGIHKLPAGHRMCVHLSPWQVETTRYWHAEDAPIADGDPVARIKDELSTISAITLRSDVPVGIALSGGLDSNAIAALAAAQRAAPLQAFSVGYQGRHACDERATARRTADRLGLRFHEIELSLEGFLAEFPKLVASCDDPVADIAAFGYCSIMRRARSQGVPVMLAGFGGDELFWGYPWVAEAAKHNVDAFGNDFEARNTPLTFFDLVPDFCLADRIAPLLYTPEHRRTIDARTSSRPFVVSGRIASVPARICQLLFDHWLIPNCIALGDRLSMASSVELRLPLLDYKLIDLAIGLHKAHPTSHLLGAKHWLKEAVKDIVPEDILHRPKSGFTPPVREWMQGALQRYGGWLADGCLVQGGVFDGGKLARFLADGSLLANSSALHFAYKVLVLETWYRAYSGMEAEHRSDHPRRAAPATHAAPEHKDVPLSSPAEVDRQAVLDTTTIPTALVVFNRPEHTARVLESLRRHRVQNLYVFSDAPRSAADADAVSRVRALLRGIDWCRPTIVERAQNLGLARSIVGAVDTVLASHEQVVLLEDDCVPQEFFFEFMGRCLARYKDNPSIFGISGYTVPIPATMLERYPYDLYFSPRIGSWGWATWRRAWRYYDRDLSRLLRETIRRGVDLAQGGNDFPTYLSMYLQGKLKDVWTLHWVLSVYLHGGAYVYPTRSHVDNIGHDGTGVHCSKSHGYDTSFCDGPPERFPADVVPDPALLQHFRSFYQVGDAATRSAMATLHRMATPVRSHSDGLRVAYVSTLDKHGGAAKVAWSLKQGLAKRGLDTRMLVGRRVTDDADVQVITDGLVDRPDDPGDGLLSYHIQSTFRLPQNPWIQDADLVHLHNLHGGYFNLAALPELARTKPCVWTLHDMHSITGHCAYAYDCGRWQTGCGECPNLSEPPAVERDATARMWHDKRESYRSAELELIVPSRWLQRIVEQSILRDKPCHLIYNGIDTSIYQPPDRQAVRRQLKVPEKAVLLGFSADGGLNNLRKGTEFILAAFERLTRRFPNVCFLNIGGSSGDRRPGLIEVPYIEDEQLLARFYGMCDAFLFPTLADNCPLGLLEVMACGVPVVSFRTGGVPELVEHGRSGLLADYRDGAQFIQAIVQLIQDSALRRSLGAAGHERVNRLFSLDVMLDQHEALYREILAPTHSERRRSVIQASRPDLSSTARAVPSEDSRYLVSAIVSTHGSERFIAGCLEDLLAQTIADRLEIIVVDSGSPENERAVVAEFQRAHDNIRYIRTERETIYRAWNRGIQAATGKYVTNANTDDRHLPEAFQILAAALEGNPDHALAYSDQYATRLTEDGARVVERRTPAGAFSHESFLAGDCLGSQPMWRRDLHQEVGLFDEQFFVSGDYEFWLRVSQRHPLFYVDQFLGDQLVTAGAVSRSSAALLEMENRIIRQRYRYAHLTGQPVGPEGVSRHPAFCDSPQVRRWRLKVEQKLGRAQPAREVRAHSDLRCPGSPQISVVVYSHGQPEPLFRSLASLRAQRSSDFEVLVVHARRDVAPPEDLARRLPGRLCLIELEDDLGRSYARNVGTSYARGSVVAFLDEEVTVDPSFVESVQAALARPGACGAVARAGHRQGADATPAEIIACAFRRSVLVEAGGFDEDLFAYETEELLTRVFRQQRERLDVVGPLHGTTFHCPGSGDLVERLRREASRPIVQARWPELTAYLDYVHRRDLGDCGFERLLAVALFLEHRSPVEAIRWVEQALRRVPSRTEGCRQFGALHMLGALRIIGATYLLGSLQLSVGKHQRASDVLGGVVTDLRRMLCEGERPMTAQIRKDAQACLLSASTKLAACHLRSENFGMVRQIYAGLLGSPLVQVPSAQQTAMKVWVSRYDQVMGGPEQARL
jgi:asparagine synthase (glutamine-hydrolysing)